MQGKQTGDELGLSGYPRYPTCVPAIGDIGILHGSIEADLER
jgi:hypothetical protein